MSSHSILCGSHREHPKASEFIGKPSPDQIIQLSLVLKRRCKTPSADSVEERLSHAELAERHGADPADVEVVKSFASEHGFGVVNVNAAARVVTISGPLEALTDLFGANVELRRLKSGVFRTRQGHLQLPEELVGRVTAVLGFDQRPAACTHHCFRPLASQPVSYTPRQVAQAYNFPTNTGTNQTIGMIELGGGYRTSDLRKYWKQLDLSNVTTTAISVDGAHNSPTGDPNSADSEVVLDIEVAGGVAPAAHIAVYFAPNTDQGFLDAINTAIHDTVHKPSVISISWGAPEAGWTSQTMDAFNAAFHDAALLGISVCAAAGDNGSSDGVADGSNHVDFPASSPWVLACGGTKLLLKGSQIQSETVWNDGDNGGATGGGVSTFFSKPSYQANVNVPAPVGSANSTGRGVPDIAGVADPDSGYLILVDGQEGVVGGTSAVAPLWAGLIALFNEELGTNVGWLHPKLYGIIAQHKVLHDITSGTNGYFKAVAGWDACTGLGTPNGQAILALLKQS